jgi:hypothetical protein
VGASLNDSKYTRCNSQLQARPKSRLIREERRGTDTAAIDWLTSVRKRPCGSPSRRGIEHCCCSLTPRMGKLEMRIVQPASAVRLTHVQRIAKTGFLGRLDRRYDLNAWGIVEGPGYRAALSLIGALELNLCG